MRYPPGYRLLKETHTRKDAPSEKQTLRVITQCCRRKSCPFQVECADLFGQRGIDWGWQNNPHDKSYASTRGTGSPSPATWLEHHCHLVGGVLR